MLCYAQHDFEQSDAFSGNVNELQIPRELTSARNDKLNWRPRDDNHLLFARDDNQKNSSVKRKYSICELLLRAAKGVR